MSKIKNGGLGQYGTEAFEHRSFGTAGVEWVNYTTTLSCKTITNNFRQVPHAEIKWLQTGVDKSLNNFNSHVISS